MHQLTLPSCTPSPSFLVPMRMDSSCNVYCQIAEQVGDWGRDGLDNQTLVAAAMGKAARDLDFIISSGDNFYGKALPIASTFLHSRRVC